MISKVTPPDGADYYIRMTVKLNNPVDCFSTGGYQVFVRAAADGSSYYKLAWTGIWSIVKHTPTTTTTLAVLPGGCSDGMVVRLMVQGNQLTAWANSNIPVVVTDSELTTGMPGVGLFSSQDWITDVRLGPIDHTAPGTVSAISSVASLHRVDLSWTAAADDTNGIGVGGYSISRGGVYLGQSSTTVFWDETVDPGSSVTYSIQAFDEHWNYSSAVTYSVTVPSSPGDESRIGVRPDGAYWGSSGEQIDMQSGNLNFSLPVLKALGRGGWGVNFALSYNSQMWRNGNGAVWLSGEDLGQGIGWKLQAGSIRPIYLGTTLHHYVFSDATGVEYRLDQNAGNTWTSLDSTYVAFDATAGRLYFQDGSFWKMSEVTSASSEQDAGTIYPSRMEDSNGNQIS